MKNRTTAWIAILLAWILLFAACGGKTGSSAKKTQNKVKESEQLNIQKYESIAEGQTVTFEDVSSFTIESVKLTDDVVPPAPDMFYTHIPAKPGRTLIDACFTYRNLRPDSTETKKVFSGELYASGIYRYDGRVKTEKSDRSDFMYGSAELIPLATEYVHCVFEIPDLIAESNCELIALITIDQKTYSLAVREGDRGDLNDLAAKDAEKKLFGDLEPEQTVLIPNTCTFRIEYIMFLQTLKPSASGDFTMYYKADEGKTYLDVCMIYCNLKNDTVNARKEITAKMKYADKYEYTCSTFTEKADGSSVSQAFSIDTAPLCSEKIHLLFEVPIEIELDSEPITVSLSIGPNTYTLPVR